MNKAEVAGGAICSVGSIIAVVLSGGNVRTAGVLTDGIGNTHGVKAGVWKTDEQIAWDWERNILQAEQCVNRWAAGKQLSDNTFSALTLLAFNVGCGAMQKSTLFQLLRQGETVLACEQFPRWVYAGGVNGHTARSRESALPGWCVMGRIAAIIGGVAILVLVVLSLLVNHYRDNAIAYKDQRDKAASTLTLANATIGDMQVRQREVAALDEKYTKELADANAENAALQSKLDAGGRVLVKGECPVSTQTETASTTSVVNDAAIELSDIAGRNVLGIRFGIISDQTALRALQEYVGDQCFLGI